MYLKNEGNMLMAEYEDDDDDNTTHLQGKSLKTFISYISFTFLNKKVEKWLKFKGK